MFSFFLPKYVSQGRDFIKDAKKLLAYKRDLLTPPQVAAWEGAVENLETAVRGREQAQVEGAAEALDKVCASCIPVPREAGMRENCEVFLVAIVIALAVRTYFLQPFTIPTGSMQPTLNGVIGTRTTEPPPNVLVRGLQMVVFGRDWLNVVAQADGEQVVEVEEVKKLFFFTRSEIRTTRGTYTVAGMRDTVERAFLESPGHVYRAGEVIARGYIDTGDHVFVDKFSYHFRKPHRAEVFVFNTLNLPTNENRLRPGSPSQFYIKRLGGLPEDQLRIAPPQLFVNGEAARERGFQRVIEQKEPGYRGYSNGPLGGAHFGIMGEPDITFTVPPKNYFALGDNSYHSSDSRDWGPLPEQNIVGRGVLVYWPFTSHFGLIR